MALTPPSLPTRQPDGTYASPPTNGTTQSNLTASTDDSGSNIISKAVDAVGKAADGAKNAATALVTEPVNTLKSLDWTVVLKYVLLIVLVLIVLSLLSANFEGFQMQGLRAGNTALGLSSRKEGASFGVRTPPFVPPPRYM